MFIFVSLPLDFLGFLGGRRGDFVVFGRGFLVWFNGDLTFLLLLFLLPHPNHLWQIRGH